MKTTKGQITLTHCTCQHTLMSGGDSTRTKYLLIILLLFTVSCTRQKKNEVVIHEPVNDSYKREINENYNFKGDSLVMYEYFLNQLDESEIDNLSLATKKFSSLFKGQNEKICDSAYYLFELFYSKVDNKINEIHLNDTTDYDSLVLDFEPGLKIEFSKKLTDYNNKLKENGFTVSMTEGSTYLSKDRDFITKHFYGFVSPLMMKYLDQLNKENKEGYWEDGGLTIEPSVLVERVIWWEEFNRTNPNFIFKRVPFQLQRIYTNTLITGEDNTPLFYDEMGPLDIYYKTAYELLFKKYPDSETSRLLRPYYTYLNKMDTFEMNRFKKENLRN